VGRGHRTAGWPARRSRHRQRSLRHQAGRLAHVRIGSFHPAGRSSDSVVHPRPPGNQGRPHYRAAERVAHRTAKRKPAHPQLDSLPRTTLRSVLGYPDAARTRARPLSNEHRCVAIETPVRLPVTISPFRKLWCRTYRFGGSLCYRPLSLFDRSGVKRKFHIIS